MLQISNISKQYKTGDLVQQALDDVSLNLRDNEFVAVLGPSGSGKTTLLNIIGGLDRYDSGDLIINGVSTKKYKDRDWDSYRNHTVGFVFQSYNLIPHQTVLQNVELALTIGGISKRKRREMALNALEQVGLRDQAHKKPNQMSGGQMQRVAIARSLVNNPRILLADEPTGALDTHTSIQVMELLKEVAKDRLVVMVTHNPELAEEYANRIVRLRDGVIQSDTNPLEIEDDTPAVHKNLGKASMSVFTSFGLSLNNLLTKKGRTILTAFAGSIGIIGIALILSLSAGFQNYIDQIQEETMTSYPLTLTAETTDMYSAILTMRAALETEAGEEELVEQPFITSMVGSISTNDLKSFKVYLEDHEAEYAEDVKLIQYGYSVSPVIYTVDAADNLAQINPNTNTLMSGSALASMSQFSSMSSVFSEITDLEMTQADNDLLAGRWPESYNEMLVVVSDPHQISDLLLYSLGFRDTTELRTLITNVMLGEEVETDNENMTITYDDLLNLELKLIDPTDKYVYNEKYDIYEDMSGDKKFMAEVYENAEELKIVGIACSKQNAPAIAAGVLYMPELTRYVMDRAAQSEIVTKQMADKDVDVFSGNRFDEEPEETGLDFQEMISVDEDMIAEAFTVNMPDTGSLFDESNMQGLVMASAQSVAANLENVTQSMVQALTEIDRNVADGIIQGYITNFTVDLASLGSGNFPFPTMGAEEPAAAPAEATVTAEPEAEPEPDTPAPDGTDPEPDTDTDPDTDADPDADPDADTDPDTETGDGGDPDPGSDPDGGDAGSGSTGPGGPGGFPGFPDVPDIPTMPDLSGEYLIISASGLYMPDMYKAQALSDEVLAQMVNQMGGLKISAANLKKIVTEAFDLYMAGLTPNAMGMVPVDELPDPAEAIGTALANNRALIFEEGYGMAKEYSALLVAAGIGETVSQVMAPMSDLFSGGEDMLSVDADKFAEAFTFDMDENELSRIMETMMSGSESSYAGNLLSLGYQAPDDPTTISIYFNSFESKGNFIDFLEAYNDSAPEEKQISYTDLTGLLMGSVETIINSVTYVLIAFVSISLIVSSIMIGIITYISVLERTKEIGILRAIGASKRNVSSIFNAETFIIGFLSGLIGVGVTYVLNNPINHIIHTVTENYDITAVLPSGAAVILVIIATVLTMIGGLIPSRSASKKDPVIALRTE